MSIVIDLAKFVNKATMNNIIDITRNLEHHPVKDLMSQLANVKIEKLNRSIDV